MMTMIELTHEICVPNKVLNILFKMFFFSISHAYTFRNTRNLNLDRQFVYYNTLILSFKELLSFIVVLQGLSQRNLSEPLLLADVNFAIFVNVDISLES